MRQIKISPSVTLRTEILEKYMRDIMNFSMISPEEETELAIKIQSGDDEALSRLVESNLRFVISVAKHYQNMGLPLSDLINEGNIGLIKAARLFDPTRGMKFITYAVWWIRQQIHQAISQSGRTIRIPVNKSGLISKIGKVNDALEQQLERDPTEEELALEMKLPINTIKNAISNSLKTLSFDMPTGEDKDNSMLDYIPDKSNHLTETLTDREDLKIELERFLGILSKREKCIIKMYYGIDSDEYTFEEIADKIGICSERVRQLKEGAIKKLRQSTDGKSLLEYL